MTVTDSTTILVVRNILRLDFESINSQTKSQCSFQCGWYRQSTCSFTENLCFRYANERLTHDIEIYAKLSDACPYSKFLV